MMESIGAKLLDWGIGKVADCEKILALRFRIAKQDYCEQLVNWYDDVKFAGIAVEGQVIEEAKELENIFVMPDAVAEKRSDRANAALQAELPFAQPVHEILESFYGDYESRGRSRQLALLAEQQRSVRQSESQGSGAKVLASQLLQQHHSNRRKDSLRKALADNDRIKLLAQNPLILTIIALIHRYQGRLPRKRYELYDSAVKTILTKWDSNKEITSQTKLKYLDLDDLHRLMEQLDYWIIHREIQEIRQAVHRFPKMS